MEPPQTDRFAAARRALDDGDADTAAVLLEALLQAAPGRVDALALLAQIALQRDDPARARRLLDEAVARAPAPALPALRANRAAVLLAAGEFEMARTDAAQAAASQPGLYGAWLNLGLAQEALEEHLAAAQAFSRALALRPDELLPLKGVARAQYRSGGAHHAARGALLQALDRDPGDAMLRLLLANSYLHDGEIDAARAEYDRLERAHPQFAEGGSAALIARHYDPAQTPETLYQAHCAWASRHAPMPAPARPSRARGGSTLRVGWISPRFSEGPLESLVLPAMQALASHGVEQRLFASHPPQGRAGARFVACAHAVHELGHSSEAEAAERLRREELDVVVDLAGHAPGNRLRALARRVAPLQVSWGDWFGTTGVPAIDRFLSDDFLTPPGAERDFSESVLRLARGRFPFRAACDAAPVPVPSGAGPHFVSFNRVAKLNDDVLRVWARILRRCPGSRLTLRAASFDDAQARRAFLDRAARCGLDPARIDLHGFAPHLEVLRAYGTADVALDPFPFSGCATSADALWMGVPVVTWPQRTLVSRQSGALLSQLGLPEGIAQDAEDYVERAVTLAGDHTGRVALRDGLRAQMQTAFDPAAFAPILLDALRC